MLRDWLLIPVANPQMRQEQNYNFSHSSTRTAVERSIGVVKRRWHCLRRLRVSPRKACQIIVVYSLMLFHFIFLCSVIICFLFYTYYCTQCTNKGDDDFADSEYLSRRPVRSSLCV